MSSRLPSLSTQVSPEYLNIGASMSSCQMYVFVAIVLIN